jgi:Cu+-exporting ATPase
MPETHAHDDAMPTDVLSAGQVTEIEPVCGMTVMLKPDGRQADYNGATFHFGSEKCQTRFGLDPWFYTPGNALRRCKVVKAGTTTPARCTR